MFNSYLIFMFNLYLNDIYMYMNERRGWGEADLMLFLYEITNYFTTQHTLTHIYIHISLDVILSIKYKNALNLLMDREGRSR